ncbi:MAG: hypothetical protein GF364_05255 [Candidatus Lokiarchaeota archaeon]|nr:hypothetical protein [Candidatus Lokiarchaeota archaeon]
MRKNLRRKNLALVLIILFIPGGLGMGYIAGMSYILNDMKSYSYNYILDYDILKDKTAYCQGDFDYLHTMAHTIDYRFENYHIPLNFTTNAVFVREGGLVDYTNVSIYDGTYDSTLWTGTALLGQLYRYKTAKREHNIAELTNATRIMKKLYTALETNLIVPSGGYGPEHPGILARCAVPPENKSLFPGVYESSYNGSGPYSDWKAHMYTSRDSMAGWLLGMACILEVAAEIGLLSNVSNCIEQFTVGFLQNDWLAIDGDGNPHGPNFTPTIFNSGWALSLLQLAKAVDIEQYERLYYYISTRCGHFKHVSHGSDSQLIVDYYAFNFGADAFYPLIIFETDEVLRNAYVHKYNLGIYNPTKNHRNCYFNILYLLYNEVSNKNIEKDILDQLMRYNISRNPYRDYQAKLIAFEIDSTMSKWKNFFENNPIGTLYEWMGAGFKDFDIEFYTKPRTLDMWDAENDFIWQRNPFKVHSYNAANEAYEESGITYSVPYWICRYLNIIPKP